MLHCFFLIHWTSDREFEPRVARPPAWKSCARPIQTHAQLAAGGQKVAPPSPLIDAQQFNRVSCSEMPQRPAFFRNLPCSVPPPCPEIRRMCHGAPSCSEMLHALWVLSRTVGALWVLCAPCPVLCECSMFRALCSVVALVRRKSCSLGAPCSMGDLWVLLAPCSVGALCTVGALSCSEGRAPGSQVRFQGGWCPTTP